jgi:hypothetical protein
VFEERSSVSPRARSCHLPATHASDGQDPGGTGTHALTRTHAHTRAHTRTITRPATTTTPPSGVGPAHGQRGRRPDRVHHRHRHQHRAPRHLVQNIHPTLGYNAITGVQGGAVNDDNEHGSHGSRPPDSFLPACFRVPATFLPPPCHLPATFRLPACYLPATCLPPSCHLPAGC